MAFHCVIQDKVTITKGGSAKVIELIELIRLFYESDQEAFVVSSCSIALFCFTCKRLEVVIILELVQSTILQRR